MRLLKKILQWRSASMVTTFFSARTRKQQIKNTKSNTLYLSIVDLPLRNFKDCLLNQNLHSLVISGHPSPDELQLRWDALFSEYIDAIGDQEYKMFLRVYKELAIASSDLEAIESLIALLAEYPYDGYKEHLCDMLMYDFDLSDFKSEKYFNELKKAWNMSRSLKIEVDLKTIQFNGLQKRFSKKGGLPTEEYFSSVLITLSDHAGYLIHDDISVWDFCERMKRFNQHCENLKKQRR